MVFLKENGFGSLDEAVEFQKRSVGDDRFRIVDLAAQFVRQTDATYQSMRWRYSVIRSFFLDARGNFRRSSMNVSAKSNKNVESRLTSNASWSW